MKPRRFEKFQQVVNRRQPDITLILENVTDVHNIGAVLRTADSVGMGEIFILNSDAHLQKPRVTIGKRTSMGSRKWVDVRYFTNPVLCFESIRSKYGRILGAVVGEGIPDLHEVDMTVPTALLFGNEHRGISDAVKPLLDGGFTIPQMGMAESLNVSVACGVTLYEVLRQRKRVGFYDPPYRMTEEERFYLFETYKQRHEARWRGTMQANRED